MFLMILALLKYCIYLAYYGMKNDKLFSCHRMLTFICVFCFRKGKDLIYGKWKYKVLKSTKKLLEKWKWKWNKLKYLGW